MKKLCLAIVCMLLLFACEAERAITEENLVADTLIGNWQLTEQNVSIGGPSTWQTVEDGEIFTLASDGQFMGFNWVNCSTGNYETTQESLILRYDCPDNSNIFTYSLEKDNEEIILSPKTVICTETCKYKYRKLRG